MEEEITKYWSEESLYFLFKLANIKRIFETPLTSLDVLASRKDSLSSVIAGISKASILFGLKFESWIFNEKKYELKYTEDYNIAKYYFEKEKSDPNIILFKKIFSNNFNLEDLQQVDDFFIVNDVYEESRISRESVLDCIEFKIGVFSESFCKLNDHVNGYIKKFIEGRLLPDKKNVLIYPKQKALFLLEIKKNIDKYGSKFIYEESIFNKGLSDPLLTVHLLVAFEFLNYIKIVNIWVGEFSLEFAREFSYCSSVEILSTFFSEVLGEVKNIVNQDNPRFSDGILFFKGKEIDFSRKQNQKDLLNTLFKDKNKNWSYDEIQEDWDRLKKLNIIKYPKNYWKKFYSASNGINTVVAIETTIKDFIIKDTKHVRINIKYVS